MNELKKRWDFTVSDVAKAEQLIHEFLHANNYSQYITNGIIWYQFIDRILIGKACFEYYINANQITIFAYLGDYNNPATLDHTLVGWSNSPGKMKYLSMLNILFNNLNQLGVQGQQYAQPQQNMNSTVGQSYSTGQQYAQPQQNMNSIQGQLTSNNDKFAIIALVASIINLICSCFGVVFGIVIQIGVYIIAAVGLKSNKKSAAIAAIIINSIAFIISVALIIISVMS